MVVTLPTGAFADFVHVLADTQIVGGNAVLTAPTGDHLTLTGVGALALLKPNLFSFHA